MTDEAESTAKATYHAFKSTDGGATWQYVGAFQAASRDSALHAAFPEKVIGTQYVAVAGSFWQPVEVATRPVHYVRTVTSLRPVGESGESQQRIDDEPEPEPEPGPGAVEPEHLLQDPVTA